MSPTDAAVLIRMIPAEFRGPDFTVTRNNVYRRVAGEGGKVALRLVGQLQDGPPTRLPVAQAARLFGGGGQIALQALSAIGSVASVANLAVCVVGFIHVSKGLRRIEARLERVEQKLDAVADLVGVVDQKVDQLLGLAGTQIAALAEVHGLLLSFQTAKVHRALETLDFRVGVGASARDTPEIMAAAAVLHEYRVWLAHTRMADPTRPLSARAELLRAEVLVAVAEARARCSVNDAPFAAKELESVLDGIRGEGSWMRERLMESAALPAFLACNVPGVEDMHAEAVDAWSWLDRKSQGHSRRLFLRETTHSYNVLSQRLRSVGLLARAGGAPTDNATYYEPMVSDADAASLLLAVRLGRNLESSLAMCTVVEVLGEPGHLLLLATEHPASPAVSLELVKEHA